MDKKVIVIIPVYNGEKFITEALESAINQTIKANTIVVSDNNSNDKTREILTKIIKKYPCSNIKLYKNEVNLGYHNNLNKCLEYSKGFDYLVILCADDILKPDMIESHINFFSKYPYLGLIGSKEDMINERGVFLKTTSNGINIFYNAGNIYEYVIDTAQYIADSSIMYDRTKLDNVGIYQTNTLFSNELFNMRVLQKYPILIRGDSVVYRRDHKQNQLYEWAKNRRNDYIGEIKNYDKLVQFEKRPDFQNKLREYYKNRFPRMLIALGASSIRKNVDIKGATIYLFNAALMKPIVVFSKPYLKSLFLIILNALGLYRLFYNIHHK